jgi:hypothetical protein
MSRALIARRSSMARKPSATWSSGSVRSKTWPGSISRRQGRRRPLRDLVRVVRRRQPGPDVQELADTRLCDQEVHRPGQERPLRPDRDQHIRVRGGDLLGDSPVGREVVLAA